MTALDVLYDADKVAVVVWDYWGEGDGGVVLGGCVVAFGLFFARVANRVGG